MVALLPILVALAGLLLYALPLNGKVQQLGFALFCIGAWFTVAAVSGRTVRLL